MWIQYDISVGHGRKNGGYESSCPVRGAPSQGEEIQQFNLGTLG